MSDIAFRTCPLCEATCGLTITLDGDRVTQVRGDDDDVFSRGYVCPKGIALGELHHDPSRLRYPLIRGVDGVHRRATWDEAWAEIGRLLSPVRSESGPESIALYLGNPNAHNVSTTLYGPALIRALGTHQVFTASTVDQMPAQVAAGLMFGTGLSVPIPDIDRTHYFLVLGANPLVSNGSMMTAPDMPGRLRALKARGGRLVVVDPLRTRTADLADEHLRIRPGTDASASPTAAVTRSIPVSPDGASIAPSPEATSIGRKSAAPSGRPEAMSALRSAASPKLNRPITGEAIATPRPGTSSMPRGSASGAPRFE